MKIEKGKLIERINRFKCKVNIRGKEELVYLANSGRLEELIKEGKEVILIENKGKLPYKLIGVKKDKIWISLDSHFVNKFFEREIINNIIPFLKNWKIENKEKKMNGSRIDFVLRKGNIKMFCEIKSCTLVINNIALFPDAPTLRGIRHLENLIENKRKGNESSIIFIVQREDAKSFAPNSFTHLDFSKILYKAMLEGVNVYLITTKFNPYKISLKGVFYKKLDIFEILKNEYHLWRYPEVFINKFKKEKNKIYIEMRGTTCYHCSFEENLFDFIEFAKERGLDLKLDNIISEPGKVKAKIFI
ncbi:MAG: DNA/RNA nuclease SfsA [candidate division WOR-3 bacterium]